jgi:hypothetical protein
MILSYIKIDVKSAFLNGPIKEKVYVEQPLGFEDDEYPNYVYRLQEYGMNALEIFLLKIILGLVRWIPLSSLGKWARIYLYAKYMLMISFLALLMSHFMNSLARS